MRLFFRLSVVVSDHDPMMIMYAEMRREFCMRAFHQILLPGAKSKSLKKTQFVSYIGHTKTPKTQLVMH